MDIKTWIFPTICFVLFCYAMVFVGIFTYHINPNVSLFQNSQTQKVAKDPSAFQQEFQDAMK